MTTTKMQSILDTVVKQEPQKVELHHQSILLYGAEGVGKTTIAASFPNSLYIDLESGTTNQSVNRLPVASWAEFRNAVVALRSGSKSGDLAFDTVIVDTATRLWELCRRHVLAENKWEVEADGPYGSGWAKIRDEFRKVMNVLFQLGVDGHLGLVLITHEAQEEVTLPSRVLTKFSPLVPDKDMKKFLAATVQMELRVTQQPDEDGNQTVQVWSKAGENYPAKDRSKRIPNGLVLTEDDPYGIMLKEYNKEDK